MANANLERRFDAGKLGRVGYRADCTRRLWRPGCDVATWRLAKGRVFLVLANQGDDGVQLSLVLIDAMGRSHGHYSRAPIARADLPDQARS